MRHRRAAEKMPEACEACGQYGGWWAVEGGTVRRCGCPRGRALLALDVKRRERRGRKVKPAEPTQHEPADWQRKAAGDL